MVINDLKKDDRFWLIDQDRKTDNYIMRNDFNIITELSNYNVMKTDDENILNFINIFTEVKKYIEETFENSKELMFVFHKCTGNNLVFHCMKSFDFDGGYDTEFEIIYNPLYGLKHLEY